MAESASGLVDRPVKITSPYEKTITTTVRVLEWTPEERSSRVMKRLGMWWGGALCAALVPPHIPWFTIAFLGGPFAAWLASRQKAMLQEQDVTCPDCGTPSHLDEQAETWPLGARCSPCRTVFWITAESPAQPA
jgi:hypothetical protein